MASADDKKRDHRVRLNVDGTDIPLNAFAEEIIRNIVEGMIRSLKGIKQNPQRITLTMINGAGGG
jgi:hypothetical protein